jgi:hypothetical protein
MKSTNKLLFGLGVILAAAGFAEQAAAADTSVTVNVRTTNTGVGSKKVVGLIKATVTSAAASAGSMTIDQPSATTQPILGWVAEVRGASGGQFTPRVTYASPTFTISNGNGGTSTTLVADQSATIILFYER